MQIQNDREQIHSRPRKHLASNRIDGHRFAIFHLNGNGAGVPLVALAGTGPKDIPCLRRNRTISDNHGYSGKDDIGSRGITIAGR